MGDFVSDWERIKKKGRLRYSLTQGFIFGVVVALIKNRKIIWNFLKGNEIDFSIILTDFFWIFIGGSIGFYFIVWWWKERLYKKEKKKILSGK